MAQFPRDNSLDSTFALVSDPYRFISKRCHRFKSDIFQTRIALQTTLCMLGREAAELFYDPERFARKGAMPGVIHKTLTGQGGVQGLDDAPHHHRKQMFMALVTGSPVRALTTITADYWLVYARKWQSATRVVLYDEVRELLCRAVCAWAGVPLAESEVELRTAQLTALFADTATLGVRHLRSRLARRRLEQWLIGLVECVRAGDNVFPVESLAQAVALHRDLNGNLLPSRTAAVELLNILRPTVAVSVFIVFAAHALHQHPELRQQLEHDTSDYTHWFVQEVRRFYPFFPMAAARVRRDFQWKGYEFQEGTRVLLDLYGTNHDSRTWNDPEQFQPERFRDWDGNLYRFIPQGGGNPYLSHRCPGEDIAVDLMKQATRFLIETITYMVPEQDLRIDYGRPPALPHDGLIITNVGIKAETRHTSAS